MRDRADMFDEAISALEATPLFPEMRKTYDGIVLEAILDCRELLQAICVGEEERVAILKKIVGDLAEGLGG